LCPFSALDTGSDSRRAYLTRLRGTHRFSLNLSVLPSSQCLPGHVSCRSHSWGLPSRAFPSLESRTPLGACSPPVVASWQASGRPRLPAACFLPTAPPPSGVSSSSEAVHAAAGVSLDTAVDALLGFLPPRVSHGTGEAGLHQPSSHVLWRGSGKPRGFPSPCARHLRVSLTAPCGFVS